VRVGLPPRRQPAVRDPHARRKAVAFHGEDREIDAPERFVWTFGFDGMPGPPGIESYAFTEADGRTTLVSVALFDSIESRDAAIQSGMEKGAAETWDRLEELLRTLAS
jgi:uncharacterized protein YndB with AHSA1/START domain